MNPNETQWILLLGDKRLTVVDSNAAMVVALDNFTERLNDGTIPNLDDHPLTLELWSGGRLVCTMLALLETDEDEGSES